MLYRWNNEKFEEEYLRKLEKNWTKMKVSFSKEKIFKERVILELRIVNFVLNLFFSPFRVRVCY